MEPYNFINVAMLLVVEEYHMRKILILLVLALLVGCSSEQVATTQPVQASAGSQTVEAEPVMHALTLSLYDEVTIRFG